MVLFPYFWKHPTCFFSEIKTSSYPPLVGVKKTTVVSPTNRLRGAFQQCGARCWEISGDEKVWLWSPKIDGPPKKWPEQVGGLRSSGSWMIIYLDFFGLNPHKFTYFFNRRYTDNTLKRGVKRIRMDATYFVEQIDVAVAFKVWKIHETMRLFLWQAKQTWGASCTYSDELV